MYQKQADYADVDRGGGDDDDDDDDGDDGGSGGGGGDCDGDADGGDADFSTFAAAHYYPSLLSPFINDILKQTAVSRHIYRQRLQCMALICDAIVLSPSLPHPLETLWFQPSKQVRSKLHYI
ncbi:hypothetical protein AK812_SmicGene17386 [Symbiodinium microadriaticum]|uniref:Uncharacterized protein n=1 Tax=Symbiodinium microadriaticum TaxID=2951 RepID=A0A1Q9DXS0_SYMMI|nr:hypothetical protein AK812_SmicGene17386 [Symbiodinium microadriaticum]